MPRTRQNVSRPYVAALLMMMSIGGAEAGAAPPAIVCSVRAPASVKRGDPIPFTLTLDNRGTTTLAILNWGTPFEEAWLQPFVTVKRDGVPLAYSGAMVKRADPDFEEYFSLAPRERREAAIDLALAFDFAPPGRYTIVSQVALHDVASFPVQVPRARAVHQSHPLTCQPVTVVVTG